MKSVEPTYGLNSFVRSGGSGANQIVGLAGAACAEACRRTKTAAALAAILRGTIRSILIQPAAIAMPDASALRAVVALHQRMTVPAVAGMRGRSEV